MKVTISFPTREHANAFAIWAEQTNLEDFLVSSLCKAADDLTTQEIGDVNVVLDDDSIQPHHEIELR